MRVFRTILLAGLTGMAGMAAPAAKGAAAKIPAVDAAAFDKSVKPILKNTCSGCHNATVTSGGVNLIPYLEANTVTEDRPAWEKIAQKIESGEMPPAGMPRP